MTDISNLNAALARIMAAMPVMEHELNAADAKLGDGDTGAMLARVLGKISECPVNAEGDLGKSFAAWAQAAAMATGSSLGTLLATGLMTFAKAARGKSALDAGEIGPILLDARDALLKRGQSALGDKTVIDGIDAVGEALNRGGDPIQAADAVLERFRDQPCRIGRARMFGDQSRGLDDPGMLAFVKLTRLVAGA